MVSRITILSILIFIVSFSFGQETSKERAKHFNLKKTIALSAYDPVSYFTGTPVKGEPNFIHQNNGIVYMFSSKENMDAFIKNPNRYEPAYGGWCAYAMGLDKPDKVSVNPKTYKIIDDKLYLFYNKLGINTKEKWNKEGEQKLKAKADKNWNNIISK